MNDDLFMWTVYDHPRDFPNTFVARRFRVDAEGARAMSQVIESADIDLIREMLVGMGLTCLTRSPDDDPHIVETWL